VFVAFVNVIVVSNGVI